MGVTVARSLEAVAMSLPGNVEVGMFLPRMTSEKSKVGINTRGILISNRPSSYPDFK
jgi:hypothetical protein